MKFQAKLTAGYRSSFDVSKMVTIYADRVFGEVKPNHDYLVQFEGEMSSSTPLNHVAVAFDGVGVEVIVNKNVTAYFTLYGLRGHADGKDLIVRGFYLDSHGQQIEPEEEITTLSEAILKLFPSEGRDLLPKSA